MTTSGTAHTEPVTQKHRFGGERKPMFKKTLAAVAAAALLVLATPTTAYAADGDVHYLTDADFPAETQPYTPEWFTGGGSNGTLTSTADGLEVAGLYQILNADIAASGLESLVNTYELNVVSGEVWAQISLFFDTDNKFTTLRQPVTSSTAVDPAGQWTTSWAVADLVAGSTNSLQDYLDRFDGEYEILGFGAYVSAGQTAVIESIEWSGETHLFTPAPPVPNPISTLDVADTAELLAILADADYVPEDLGDVTHTTGTSTAVSIVLPWAEDDAFVDVYLFSDQQVVGVFPVVDGEATITLPASTVTGLEPGVHHLVVVGQTSGEEVVWEFNLVLNAATDGTGDSELAGTGTEAIIGVLFVAVLIGAGVVAVGYSRRAKARIHA